MKTEPRYHWLKLKDDFFKSKELKKLRKIAGGDTFTIIYLKMQLLSLKNDGKLFFDGIEDSFAEELSLELDETVDNIKMTLVFLKQTKLIEEIVESQFLLPQAVNAIGSETTAAERMRRHRSKDLNVTETNNVTVECNIVTQRERKSKEIEKYLVQVHAQKISDSQDFILEKIPKEQFFPEIPQIKKTPEYVKEIQRGAFKNWQRIAKEKNAKFMEVEWDAIFGYIGGNCKCSLTSHQITTNILSLHKWANEGLDIINSLNRSHDYKAIITPTQFCILYDKNNKRLYGQELINHRIRIILEEEKIKCK